MVTDGYQPILDLACAKVDGGQLHIVARCTKRSGGELLVHTVRFANGTLQAGGEHDIISMFSNAATLRGIRTVAAAGIDGALHVVGSTGTEQFHTIRLNDVAWQASFGPIRPAVDGIRGCCR